ncbi:MAG: CCA tRNA nucleotidyltransferase [Planctomycetes bacterium]|jgi:poly(A) polymerase|nr:CCA tRNA nucleotidyltransferase [Planctomycetota bacterium]
MARPANRQTAVEVVSKLRDAGYEALFAGGCVRDMLLGAPSVDYDVATSATPDDISRLFRRVLMIGAKFGVAMVILKGRMIEVTTFRSDLDYADGRRPEGVRFTNAQEDAMRRDFTINGMFYDPLKDEVIDYVGGREDLNRRLIRTIGEPDRRFGEDYLRMIRAVRFAVRLGFELDDPTARAIAAHAPKITGISGERIFDELRKMLARPDAPQALRLMNEMGLARHVLPELFAQPELWDRAVDRLAAVAAKKDLHSALGAVLAEVGPRDIAEITRRWGGSNEIKNSVLWQSKHLHLWAKAPEMSLAEFKKLLAHGDFNRLRRLWAYEEQRANGSNAVSKAVVRRIRSIDPAKIMPRPFVSGDDIKKMGMAQGPEMGAILKQVFDLQLNEQLPDRQAALKAAQTLVNEQR